LGNETDGVNDSTTNSNWQSKWEYEYDPVLAGKMLDEAGWPLKDGKSFDISLYGLDFLQAIQQEVADAVSGFWDAIGVKTSVQKYAYSVYRPTVVARATTLPWVTPCDDGRSTWPWDWPKAQDHTTPH
jgi:ABC-type transport system substrate-binding protein